MVLTSVLSLCFTVKVSVCSQLRLYNSRTSAQCCCITSVSKKSFAAADEGRIFLILTTTVGRTPDLVLYKSTFSKNMHSGYLEIHMKSNEVLPLKPHAPSAAVQVFSRRRRHTRGRHFRPPAPQSQ